ncbi:hypothetical protein ACWDA7_19495 [Streptomyces sp. NPDC001156]
MSAYLTALTGLGTAVAVGLVAVARTWPHPSGRHRARRAADTSWRRPLLRPQEAMANDVAWCPAERRTTMHAFLRLGGRQCWDCRHITPHHPLTNTPTAGGAE